MENSEEAKTRRRPCEGQICYPQRPSAHQPNRMRAEINAEAQRVAEGRKEKGLIATPCDSLRLYLRQRFVYPQFSILDPLLALAFLLANAAYAQNGNPDALANLPFTNDYPTKATITVVKDQLF